ncbi:hypothetical protein Vretifemale_2635 [Volvox reticuliferus]|nr:hypothetical protein Vretifemale_2635 [Volvox reticuliferus]
MQSEHGHPASRQVIVLVSNMVASGTSLDSMDTLPGRESFVTIAPGALDMDALGSLAYSSSALDPKFVSKTISLRSTTIDLPMLVSSSSPVRKTKLGFTVGPACKDYEVLKQLVTGGANIARFNFAHGTRQEHQEMYNKLRSICAEERRTVAIMLDLEGNVVRTSNLIERETKKPIDKIELQVGDKVELYGTDDISPSQFVGYKAGNKARIGVSLADLPDCVKVGGLIRIHDGLINVEVTSVRPGGPVNGTVLNHAFLYPRKPVHLVGVTIHAAVPAAVDLEAMSEFAITNQVDFVAMAVNSRNDLAAVRGFLDDNGGETIKLVSSHHRSGFGGREYVILVCAAVIGKGRSGPSVQKGDDRLSYSFG